MTETRFAVETSADWCGESAAPRYLTSPLLTCLGVPHAFTTRHFPGATGPRDPGSPFGDGGLSFLGELGIGPLPVAFLKQVHGADVVVASDGGLAGRGDVIATSRAGLPLAISTADCVPVVVYDPERRRLAMAHSGWRGTALGAAQAAARALIELGGAPATFGAAIGPSIGACCYEVDAPVIEKLESGFPDRWRSWVTETAPGKWMLDLWLANEDQLSMAGVDRARIDNPRLCTSCRPDLFYSYRRGRAQGRLIAVAAVPDPPRPAC